MTYLYHTVTYLSYLYVSLPPSLLSFFPPLIFVFQELPLWERGTAMRKTPFQRGSGIRRSMLWGIWLSSRDNQKNENWKKLKNRQGQPDLGWGVVASTVGVLLWASVICSVPVYAFIYVFGCDEVGVCLWLWSICVSLCGCSWGEDPSACVLFVVGFTCLRVRGLAAPWANEFPWLWNSLRASLSW